MLSAILQTARVSSDALVSGGISWGPAPPPVTHTGEVVVLGAADRATVTGRRVPGMADSPSPAEDARRVLAQAQQITANIRQNEQAVLAMTDDELSAFKSDLEVAYATIEAALAQTRTLLAVRRPDNT